MRREVRFLRRGREVRLADFSPTLTLLDYLRLNERATGTKEGCAEGDCGACTVVLRRAGKGGPVYQPLNACIMLAGQCDGSEVITVEDLADQALHPVQQALVDQHGSQCGFCTPGFVMALFALYHARKSRPLDRGQVNDWLAGNLCRCTGYRPIVDAALAACSGKANDRFAAEDETIAKKLSDWDDRLDVFVGTDKRFFAAPVSVHALAELYARHPDAVLLAGATDVGLWITKQLRDLPKIIWLGRVRGLDEIDASDIAVTLGAAVTHQAALPYFASIDPDFGELMRRFAGLQVRSIGTIGGNIANGSPIGDTPPALIALGATLTLQRATITRSIPLEKYFIAYGKQDRAAGEFVRSVRVPKLASDERFRCYKISKRLDQDISAVVGAFKLALDGTRIRAARVAFGGMAAIPKRADATERALQGADLENSSTWNAAVAAIVQDFAPIDDQRASAAYRRDVAQALLAKALMEISGAPSAMTRVAGLREAEHVAL
jgi:xanthine dehydrogenase small subunit